MKNCVPLNVAMRVVEWSKLPGSAQRWLAWCWRWWHLRLLQCHVSHGQWFWTEPLSEMRIKKYSLFKFRLCLSFCTYINLGNWNNIVFFNPNELQKKETILNFFTCLFRWKARSRLWRWRKTFCARRLIECWATLAKIMLRSSLKPAAPPLQKFAYKFEINTTYCWNNLQMSR